MIAALAATLALAAPGCHAPECLVDVGPGPVAGPLRLGAQRTPTRLTVVLSQPALLTLRAHGRPLDRWLAPAGRSLHPVSAAQRGPVRLTAVDGAGHHATRVLRQPAAGPRRHSNRG